MRYMNTEGNRKSAKENSKNSESRATPHFSMAFGCFQVSSSDKDRPITHLGNPQHFCSHYIDLYAEH